MNLTRYILPLIGLLIFASLLEAQNPGCDGIRYKQDVFQNVKKTSLPYATAKSHLGSTITLAIDVYEPEGDTVSKRPVVILAHGGSFVFGDKTDMTKWCLLLAKKGYVAASIQYRLYPVFVLGFPDSTKIMDTAVKALGDMKAAVRFFRLDAETANLFRADPDHIFIGGYSAGAVAALHTAFIDEEDTLPAFIQNLVDANGGLNGDSGSPDNQSYSSEINAVINLSGGLYRREWITDKEVPMSSIHGTADETVPFNYGLAANIAYLEGSGVLHSQALSVGNWSYLQKVEGGGHTNIYDQAQYASQLNSFWIQTTTLMEYLTCYADSLPVLVYTSNPQMKNQAIWSMYPNPVPAGTPVSIRLPETIQNASARLYSISGNEILRLKNLGVNNAKITTTGLPPGMYLIQLEAPQNPELNFGAKLLVVAGQ